MATAVDTEHELRRVQAALEAIADGDVRVASATVSIGYQHDEGPVLQAWVTLQGDGTPEGWATRTLPVRLRVRRAVDDNSLDLPGSVAYASLDEVDVAEEADDDDTLDKRRGGA